MRDVNINNGLYVVTSKFASIDKNSDNNLSLDGLKTTKGLNADGTEFLQKIIYNQSNLFELIESTVPNDGKGISIKDLDKIADEPNSNVAYILGETFDLETAIIQTVKENELSNPIHLKSSDGKLCPSSLLNLYAVAFYKAGIFSKNDYDSAIKGILKNDITKIKDGISTIQTDTNIISSTTRNILFQKIKIEDEKLKLRIANQTQPSKENKLKN